MAVYLSLFHGRTTPSQSLDDWGPDGPIIGPCNISFAHGCLRVHSADENMDMEEIPERDGLVEYDGMFYSDMDIWSSDEPFVNYPSNQPPHRQRISADDFIIYIRSKK